MLAGNIAFIFLILSKNKLSESFLQALAEDFDKHGKDAIKRICKSSLGEYLRIIAGMVPKEFLLEVAQEEKTTWVINAQPELTVEEWEQKYCIGHHKDQVEAVIE